MNLKAELLNPELPGAQLGEGPHWDHANQVLYWVDITGCAIHRYNLKTQKHEIRATPSMVGFTVLDRQGKLVAGLQDGIYRMEFNTTPQLLIAPKDMDKTCRFNDGKCDPQGRLWAGTMSISSANTLALGSLYRHDGKSLAEIETEIHISNGLGWSPDHKIMYYTDTVRRVIWQYDYDVATGIPVNQRIFHEFVGQGRPDGLTVDSQGRVLTALWPGWGVEIYTPDGKLDDRIALPVPQVSSCTFGGPDLKTLFITTAASEMTPEQLSEAPLSGQLFAVEMDVPGMADNRFSS